jgi:hypothetical protein
MDTSFFRDVRVVWLLLLLILGVHVSIECADLRSIGGDVIIRSGLFGEAVFDWILVILLECVDALFEVILFLLKRAMEFTFSFSRRAWVGWLGDFWFFIGRWNRRSRLFESLLVIEGWNVILRSRTLYFFSIIIEFYDCFLEDWLWE